ncbi:hypothetical protein NDU88_005123 [Pleurodeles waltl]|uniref:Uncharacterized protein n=1 Tax=Pleurodeles waltl TaxID=8319 RepID=A0AAV7VL15_PLEWA|nr:hypothetical protein NDU88_005123 [Pleurodeles waltl]
MPPAGENSSTPRHEEFRVRRRQRRRSRQGGAAAPGRRWPWSLDRDQNFSGSLWDDLDNSEEITRLWQTFWQLLYQEVLVVDDIMIMSLSLYLVQFLSI